MQCPDCGRNMRLLGTKPLNFHWVCECGYGKKDGDA